MIKDTAQFLHGELERNWACNQDPFYQPRRRNIEQMTTPVHRVVEGKMLTAARRSPKMIGTFLRRRLPKDSPMTLAGAGSAHTVLSDGETVLKIHRLSTFMSNERRNELAAQMRHDHQVIGQYLGETLLRQTTYVNINPLRITRQSAISVQKHVAFIDLGLFDGYTKNVDELSLARAASTYPNIVGQLHALAVNGIKMFDETGIYLPDTSGLNNIVVVGDNLKCMDGLPIVTEKVSDIERITGQLETLRSLTN